MPEQELAAGASARAIPTFDAQQGSPLPVRAWRAAAYIFRALGEAVRVFRTAPSRDRLGLALLVLRMRAKHFLFKLSPRWQFRRERLFGWKVECFEYFELLTTIEIIFLAREYRFEPRTGRPLILDCGSNIGVSLLFFKRQFPESRIVAFEPDPQTFSLLKRNVERNKLEGIELRNLALAGSAGPRNLFRDPARPGCTAMSLREECKLPQRETVEGVPLSGLIHEDVDFLKLDIEGAELEVIEDLVRTGQIRRIHQMVVEYHPRLFPERDGYSWLRQTLEESGFACEIRSGEAPPSGSGGVHPVTLYASRRAATAGHKA
ncbi:MAG TPA: FkbM family methyltransferase [Candidatus Acidoferrales bacterium]|nr:FkbM family methyltransferase [Candidatus Acidoferrales bacterium]